VLHYCIATEWAGAEYKRANRQYEPAYSVDNDVLLKIVAAR
jgi:hypothetical protein